MNEQSVVNIVIVSCNALPYLQTTLKSLFETTHVPFLLTIVDNCSDKDAVDYIKGLTSMGVCRKIIKIFNAKNEGYPRAVNQGLGISIKQGCDYTCFCNNDLYFTENWIDGLIKKVQGGHVAAYPIGVSSFTFVDGQSSRDIFRGQSFKTIQDEIAFLEADQNKIIQKIMKRNPDFEATHFPQYLPDHCVMVNTQKISEIGFWADEQYGLYGSNDADICWEIFRLGGKIVQTNKSFVYHFRHKTLQNNNINRIKLLEETSIKLYKKWRLEFKQLQQEKDFLEKCFDFNNRDYVIVRQMNEKIHFITQTSKIFAVFGGLGKTTLAKKYPNLVSDIEVSGYRYIYNNIQDVEKVKGLKNRVKNPEYPNNYLRAIGQAMNKKAVICVVLSAEILTKLERTGFQYEIFYPKKMMRDEILKRVRERGNIEVFQEKIKDILDRYEELEQLRAVLRPQKIWFLEGTKTLEDVILENHLEDELNLCHSSFEWKGTRYQVYFTPKTDARNIEREGFSQVYCVGEINGKLVVIYHIENGKKVFNLPGGTREQGENIEQTLRREIREETNCDIMQYKILGVQKNITENGKSSLNQVRVFAHLRPFGKFVSDPGGSVCGYELVELADLEKKIGWGEVGDWIRLKIKSKMEKK